jgi:hypothetical protein
VGAFSPDLVQPLEGLAELGVRILAGKDITLHIFIMGIMLKGFGLAAVEGLGSGGDPAILGRTIWGRKEATESHP